MDLCDTNVEATDGILLRDLWAMELHRHPNDVNDIAEQAKQVAKMEATVARS